MRALLLAVVLAGCVQDQLVVCGDTLCPVGTACREGVCVTERALCGNGVMEAGELCDDGNVLAGDGCSARCDSDETCGNGVVDFELGEQCDEGNARLSADGCSSVCTIEFPSWRRLDPVHVTGRIQPALAAFPDRHGQLVMFGGSESAETWIFDDDQWFLVHPAHSPPRRSGAAFVYDVAHQRAVLFGGHLGSTGYTDEWTWDGTDWTEVTLVGDRPTGDVLAAYEVTRGTIVAYDGDGSTWTSTGGAWTKLPHGAGTPPMAPGLMAYARGLDRTVLYLGATDTWLWDGTSWGHSAATPGSGHAFVLASPDTNGNVVFFERAVDGGPGPSFVPWNFTGSYTKVPAQSFDVRSGAAVVYDAETHSNLIVGGIAGVGLTDASLRYTAGRTFETLERRDDPPSGCYGRTVAVPTTGRVVYFGGIVPPASWDGTQWHASNVGEPALAGCGVAAAYDPDRDVMVVAGHAFGTYAGDTFTPIAGGPSVEYAALAYDPPHHRAVLWDGARTWVWDSASGTIAVVPTTGSPGLSLPAVMAFDPASSRLVLFGPKGTSLGETWELDGTTWSQLALRSSPDSASGALALGPSGELVLVTNRPGPPVWKLERDADGAGWVQVATIGTREVMLGTSLAYDAIHHALVYVGTATGASQALRIYTLSYESPLTPEVCVTGEDGDADATIDCDDPDCAGQCDPTCLPNFGATCADARPRCGDGMCGAVEDYLVCPDDCAAP